MAAASHQEMCGGRNKVPFFPRSLTLSSFLTTYKAIRSVPVTPSRSQKVGILERLKPLLHRVGLRGGLELFR